MDDTVSEAARAHLVLVRGVFFGAAAGALWMMVVVVSMTFSESNPESRVSGPILALWGATIAGGVGLVLAVFLLLAGVERAAKSTAIRLVVAVVASSLVFGAVWILTGKPPVDPVWSIFLLPAGLAAWLLLPRVLRPVRHRPLAKFHRS